MLLTFPSFPSPLLQFSSLQRHLLYLSSCSLPPPSPVSSSDSSPLPLSSRCSRSLPGWPIYLTLIRPLTNERPCFAASGVSVCSLLWHRSVRMVGSSSSPHWRLPCMWLLSLWRSLVSLVVRWLCPSFWLLVLCASCAGCVSGEEERSGVVSCPRIDSRSRVIGG